MCIANPNPRKRPNIFHMYGTIDFRHKRKTRLGKYSFKLRHKLNQYMNKGPNKDCKLDGCNINKSIMLQVNDIVLHVVFTREFL